MSGPLPIDVLKNLHSKTVDEVYYQTNFMIVLSEFNEKRPGFAQLLTDFLESASNARKFSAAHHVETTTN